MTQNARSVPPYRFYPGDTLQESVAGISQSSAYSALWPAAVPQTMIATMQSGHGFTTNGTGVSTSNLNDTTDFALGSQAVSVVTAGNNQAAQIRKLAGTNVDLTGKSIVLWFKCDDITHLQSIDVYAGNASLANFFRFRVQTAGTANTYWINGAEWMRIVIGWGDLTQSSGSPVRSTITDWQISIKDDGAGAVTYRVGGIAAVPEPSTKFPNGVVSLVFDDGWASQYSQARLKMDQYGYPGTAYVISEVISNAAYPSYMTLANLKQMQDSSGWQIAAHAYTAAGHNNRFVSYGPDDLETEMQNAKNWLRSNGFHGGDDLAWPGGDFNPATIASARKFFRSARTIIDVTHETVPIPDRYRLRAHTTINTDATASIQTLIDNAFANKQWLILLFHEIVTSPTVSTQYSIANFGTVVDYLNTKGIPVMTVGDVLRT